MTSLNPARADLLKTFALDVEMIRGSGTMLADASGTEYLDFLSQYGALPFGHNPDTVWDGLLDARRRELPSMVQPLRPVEAERLAGRLAALAPGDLEIVTFANSGAETVEAAIKLARLRTGRTGILSTRNGFHGKTLGALSATGKASYQAGFAAPAPGFGHIPYGDIDALATRLDAETDIAAFIVEPVQGEGGVIVPPEGYIDAVIRVCRARGVLVILDEIQTGLGRTGRLFACEDGAEVPDMLLLSKALGGGLMPIGACIARPDAWDDSFGERHSSTFANNNLAARAANATLDRLLADDRALVRHVDREGAYFSECLADLAGRHPEVIREARGAGFMRGVEFTGLDNGTASAALTFASLNGGLVAVISSYLLNVCGIVTAPLFNQTHVLRLQPALIATRDEIDRVIDALDEVCRVISEGRIADLVRHLAAGGRDIEAAVTTGSRPRTEARPVRPPRKGAFAFVIHYTETEDVRRSEPSFADFSDNEVEGWCAWTKTLGPGFVREIPSVISPTGDVADGWLLSVPLRTKDMRGNARTAAAAMVGDAVDMASAAGASRVGLGAFTSIVTRGGATVTRRGPDVTSGNTLTTVAAVQSLRGMAERTGIDLSRAHVAVVGATGAIGRLAAILLSREAGRMTLVGNAANPFSPKLLDRVAAETGVNTGTNVTTDLARLRGADVVVVATSAETTLVDPRDLSPGTLVCDVARPPNVARADALESGVMVFDGGLVTPPSRLDLGVFQTLPSDLCWGCLGETVLLALEGEDGDMSIGSSLDPAGADRIAELAARHGFAPSPAQWYGRALPEAEMDGFAAQVYARRTGRMAAGSRMRA